MISWDVRDRFAGLPVVEVSDEEYEDGDGRSSHPAPETVAWRISMDFEAAPGAFEETLTCLLDEIGADRVHALVVGDWGSPYENAAPVALLAGMADRLVNLRALFLGDLVGEECEVSWILQSDITPLLRAYPRLETLRVRGGTGLALGPVRHAALRELVLESGGLPAPVVRAVGGCELPALRELELWLGSSAYGGGATTDDLAGVLAGTGLPELRRLGLRDAEQADEVAAALATAPVVPRLTELDLSLGVLSDDGARALLAGQPLTHLRRLDLSHHFLSEHLAAELPSLLPGVEVDVSDRQQEEDEWGRYVAVAE